MTERHYCTRPFEFFETYDDGSIGFCCPSWYNNYEIGNINDNSVEEVWNGEAAQELRRSILDGSFRYCDEKVCPHLSTKTHCVQTLHQIEVAGDKGWDLVADDIKNNRTILNHSPLQIQFGYDRSCQLACPSCRLEVIMEGGAKREFIIGLQDKLRKEAFKDAKTFTITGTATDGTTVTEAIAGPGGSATVSTTALFETVTQVAVDAATAGAVTVGSGTTVNQTVFAGRARLRGIYIVNAGAAGDLDFKNGSSNGSTVMKLMTTGTAATADYPDIPDEGVLCADGAYVNFTTTDVTAFTVFFN